MIFLFIINFYSVEAILERLKMISFFHIFIHVSVETISSEKTAS